LLENESEVKIHFIIDSMQKQRRTGLFSATLTPKLKSLVKVGMRNPYFVEVKIYENSTEDEGSDTLFALKLDSSQKDKSLSIQKFEAVTISDKKEIDEVPLNLQNFYTVLENQSQKLNYLVNFLNLHKDKKIMIFFCTCASVEFHYAALPSLIPEVSLHKLHSKLNQNKRSKIYNAFLIAEKGVLLTTDLSARGIDIPNVDWIIQFDPPQDGENFIHRIGRTARAGTFGMSLILLLEPERHFIDFVKLKKVNFNPLENEKLYLEEIIKAKDIVRALMMGDMDYIDKAKSAFVSFIRYYKEHNLRFIFPFELLDIGNVANAFFLFKIPRVKEILGKKIKNFNEESVQMGEIEYKDKNKAKQKKEKALIREEEKKEMLLKQKKQWQDEKNKKEAANRQRTKAEKRHTKKKNTMSEWNELQEEERLARKLKKGKITMEEFDSKIFSGLI